MSFTNREIIRRFYEEDAVKGKNGKGSIYIDGDVIYSYGTHFPLSVRRETNGKKWYLQNGDRHSNTTSGHQSITFSYGKDFPRVSFSALSNARINYKTCEVIDFCSDASDFNSVKPNGKPAYKGELSLEDFKKKIPFGAIYNEKKHKDGTIDQSYHRIGSVVIKQSDNYYLCSMDEGSYFISQLPRPVVSVVDAFDSLKPEAVKLAEEKAVSIKRQGEWFFVSTDKAPKDFGLKVKDVKQITLPKTTEQSANHVVRGIQLFDGSFLVTGTVFHKNFFNNKSSGQHKSVKLETWFLAYKNTETASWSGGGRVD